MTKQAIVLRKDLKMKKGKSVAQGSHASLGVFLKMMNGGISLTEKTPKIKNGTYTLSLEVEVGSFLDDWLRGEFRKIALSVDSEEELLNVYNQAKQMNIPVTMIEDNGLTVFHGVKTKTCIAIGPADDALIDEITSNLKLY